MARAAGPEDVSGTRHQSATRGDSGDRETHARRQHSPGASLRTAGLIFNLSHLHGSPASCLHAFFCIFSEALARMTPDNPRLPLPLQGWPKPRPGAAQWAPNAVTSPGPQHTRFICSPGRAAETRQAPEAKKGRVPN